MRKITDKNNLQREADDDHQITNELAELQSYLEHYSVKYPDERTIESSIEQLRLYVPHKKQPLHQLYSLFSEAIYRVLPVQRFASFSLFLLGSLLLPSKLY